jgi:hypothetical protein
VPDVAGGDFSTAWLILGGERQARSKGVRELRVVNLLEIEEESSFKSAGRAVESGFLAAC